MNKRIPVVEAKELVLQQIAAGARRAPAMQAVGRSVETYKDWMKNDPEFKRRVFEIKEALDRGERKASVVPDFPEFSERYLGMALPVHQLRAWDVLCGREPREFHESMNYQRGDEGDRQVILNFPPDHAKSTTWTVNWVTWQIHRNPEIRVIIVSKTQRLAKQFLLSIKQQLTNPRFEQMHAAFGPEGGWKDDDLPWREDMIYVRGRDATQKDPTVQALGIGGQIYGARADLIVLDDVEDLTNYGSYEQHATWVAQEVNSRLDPEHGRLVIVGTRVGSMDIYRYLRDEAKTADDEPTFTYFSQPAILEGEHSPNLDEWRVLWPERMGVKVLRKKRAMFANPRHFSLIYQQNDVPEDAVFNAVAVEASINGQRYPGPMVPGATGHRERGMDGLYVVGAWDPASSAGCNAMVVLAGDKQTQKRWVLDAWNKRGALPRDSIAKLKEFTETYGIREWRIEKNAVQEFIVQLDEIKDYLASRGVRLVAHYTHGNKWDADKGVETLAPLFDSCVDIIDGRMVPKPKGRGLIELPHAGKNPAIRELTNQLKAWEPEAKRLVQDLVMALWFAELGVRQWLHGGAGQMSHMRSRFTTRGALRGRGVLSLDEVYRERGLHAV